MYLVQRNLNFTPKIKKKESSYEIVDTYLKPMLGQIKLKQLIFVL